MFKTLPEKVTSFVNHIKNNSMMLSKPFQK